MEFVNETDYDWRALRALNRAAIRLDRRWRSLLLRAMGVLCGLILLRGAWTSGGGAGLLYGLLGALMLVWALFLNEIRAWLVGRFVMKGVAGTPPGSPMKGMSSPTSGGSSPLTTLPSRPCVRTGATSSSCSAASRATCSTSRAFTPGPRTSSGLSWSGRPDQTMKKL